MLNKADSVLWFDDLEDGGGLKRLNQASFFKELSGEWKFYSAEWVWHLRLTNNWKNIIQDGFTPGEAYFFKYDNHKTKRSLFSRVFLNHAVQLID